jgi:hypothetical protein
MADFLYTIIIFPIVQIIELSYLFVSRVFDAPGYYRQNHYHPVYALHSTFGLLIWGNK